jgi:hypothetical protein
VTRAVAPSKRLAPAAIVSFYGVNGRRLILFPIDEAYDLVIAVADGTLDAIAPLVARQAHETRPWRQGPT